METHHIQHYGYFCPGLITDDIGIGVFRSLVFTTQTGNILACLISLLQQLLKL